MPIENHRVTIDAVDVTSFVLEYKVIDAIEDMSGATIDLSNDVSTSIDLTKEQEVIITRGLLTSTDTTIFRGVITEVAKDGRTFVVECLDKLFVLQRQRVNKTYDINIDPEAGVISDIAKDLIETFGGLTASVVASGAVNVLTKFICRNDFVLNKIQELADILDWQVRYNPATDTILFEPKGTTVVTTTLTVGDNIVNVPEWDFDYSKIINDVIVVGDLQEVETTETDTGDTVETEFTLGNKPESVKVFVNSVLQIGGIPNLTETFDYEVDKENKLIIFQSPPAAVAISFQYSYLIPIKVRGRNTISITNFGPRQARKEIATVQTVDDAEKKADEITTKFGGPIVSTNVKVFDVEGMQAGNKITVVDGINAENRELNIRSIAFNYPIVVDEVEVDDEPIFEDYVYNNMVLRRIEDLERKNENEDDLVVSLFNFDRTFKPRRRYLKVQKEIASGTGFILDHPDFGVLGTDVLGSPFAAATDEVIVQGNMTYEEYAYDTDFVNAGSTTATFNTVTNDIAFTAGQIFQTSEIDIGTTLRFITVNLGTVVGTLLIEISSDGGSTFQTVTDGTRVGVTTSDGTGTIVRITENAAGVATIDLTQDSFGQNTEPVVHAVMEE